LATITILDSNGLARWDEFVFSHELGSIYHTSAWRHVIEAAYGHQPLYLSMDDSHGQIRAGMPFFIVKSRLTGNRLVSLPAAQVCNPLVSNQEEYDQLIHFVMEFAKRRNIKSIEIKTSEPFRWNTGEFGRAQEGFSTYLLDIDKDLETLEHSFHRSCIRQKIKNASKNGLQLVVGNSPNEVKRFYELYLQLRKNYGLLPQPYAFFFNKWKTLSAQNGIEILRALYQGRTISSILLLKYKDTVTYEYGASEFDMMHLGPSPFLIWESIKRAKSQGYTRFDFGRTANDNEGLTQFKLHWATRREALRYYYIPDLGNTAQIRRQGFSKKLMYHTMHYSPAVLCQLMGRMLYKYFV
jgi:CelD/BcsL family acetyltransferase involved in cellulose biosynthesis